MNSRYNYNNNRYNNRDAYTSSEQIRNDTQARIDIILKFIGKGKKVLDVGCYNGHLGGQVKLNGNEVTGIDISEKAIKLCAKRGITCFQGDIEEKLPFKKSEFDVVILSEVIEHCYDSDKVLSEVYRVIKDCGFLVITTPNVAALTKRLKILFRGSHEMFENGLKQADGSGHIRFFSIKSLEQLLERNGFKVVDVTSDFVLLKSLRLKKLASFIPSIGWTIIIKAAKKHNFK